MLRLCLLTAIAFLFASPASGQQFLPVDTGFFSPIQAHQPNSTRYSTGIFEVFGPLEFDQENNFVAFDLAEFAGGAESARIVFRVDYGSVDSFEEFVVHEVSTPVLELIDGTTEAFRDLGDGPIFGSTVITSDLNGLLVEVEFNQVGIDEINSSAGELVAFGGTLSTLDFSTSGNQAISGSDISLEIDAAAVPEPGSAATLSAFVIALSCVRRKRLV